MKLSDCPSFFKIHNDGNFLSLGILRYSGDEVLSFLTDLSYLPILLNNSSISCIITFPDFICNIPSHIGIAYSSEPRRSFLELHNYLALNTDFYSKSKFLTNIHPTAKVSPSAIIAENNVSIGERTIIHPNVVINKNVTIGSDVIIRAGSIIGTEGFYPQRYADKIYKGIHSGGVDIGEGSELQANVTVCSGIFGGNTRVGQNCMIANGVDIAHDVTIGEKTLIGAGTILSGNLVIGSNVWIGPNSTISNNLVIGDGANISLGSVVTRSVPHHTKYSGNFAIEHEKFLQFIRTIR